MTGLKGIFYLWRCIHCGWEIWNGECVNCHHAYRNYSAHEEEFDDIESALDQEEVNSSDVDFVVSDDHIEYASASPEQEAIYISDEASEEGLGGRRSRRRFRYSEGTENFHSASEDDGIFSGIDNSTFSGEEEEARDPSSSPLQQVRRRPVILSDDED
jgi:hypothetical protein